MDKDIAAIANQPLPTNLAECQQMVHILREELCLCTAILNALSTLVMVTNRQGRIISCNQAFIEVTGYQLEPADARPFWKIFLSLNDRASVHASFEQLQVEQSPLIQEQDWVTQGGSYRRIAWTYTPFLDVENTLRYVIATGSEVTERQEQKEELERLQEVLERQGEQAVIARKQEKAVQEQLAELIKVNEELARANEEMREREWEKSVLLSVSEALSRTSNRKELVSVIYHNVRSIFPFYCSSLFIINEEEDYHEILTETEMIDIPTKFQGSIERIPYKGSAAEYLAQNYGIISRAELMERFPGHPHHIQIQLAGEEEFIHGPLINGEKRIGMLCFGVQEEGFYSEQGLRLFKHIADQITVTVANILATEEILEREKEKSQLLQISEAIATVQNHKQLLKVIYEKIQPVFPYDNAGLFVFDKTGENVFEILEDEVLPDEVQTKLTQASLLGPIPYHDHHPQFWLYTETPVITSIKEQARYCSVGAGEGQSEIGAAAGLRQMIGGPLYYGGEKIGMLSFNSRQDDFYTKQYIPLFKAISDLVSVAVANILANQEILEREAKLRESEERYRTRCKNAHSISHKSIVITYTISAISLKP